MKRQKLIKTPHQKRKPRLKHLNNNMTNIFSLPTTYKQPQSRFSSKLFVSINSILAFFSPLLSKLCPLQAHKDRHI